MEEEEEVLSHVSSSPTSCCPSLSRACHRHLTCFTVSPASELFPLACRFDCDYVTSLFRSAKDGEEEEARGRGRRREEGGEGELQSQQIIQISQIPPTPQTPEISQIS